MLHPIFEEASNVIKEEYPNENQVVFARVDCDQHCKYLNRNSGTNRLIPFSTHTYTHTHTHTLPLSLSLSLSLLF